MVDHADLHWINLFCLSLFPATYLCDLDIRASRILEINELYCRLRGCGGTSLLRTSKSRRFLVIRLQRLRWDPQETEGEVVPAPDYWIPDERPLLTQNGGWRKCVLCR
jgi:hypothetical protein